jgi:hypothetical protein
MVADPIQAAGQTPATTGQQSQENVLPRVKPGTRVWVVTSEGAERSGKLESLSPVDLAFVADDGQRVVMPWLRVRQVERPDPVLNGLVGGALIGFGGGLGVAAGLGYFGGADESSDAGSGFAIAAAYAGIGAVAGLALDAALGKRQVIYRSGPKTVSMAPLVAGRGAGVRFNVRW